MQFHIDGRFQADIRFENNAWTVQKAERNAHPALSDSLAAGDSEEDDIATFLDAIFLEAGQERYSK
jgi:hypothetical protein